MSDPSQPPESTLSSTPDDLKFETLALRAAALRTELGEHSEAIFATSSYVFKSAAQAAARFGNTEEGNVYSRFTNPTVDAFAARLAALEGTQDGLATASGMSAILCCMMALLKAGDHVVTSQSIFGSTVQLFNTVLAKFGIQTTFVDLADVQAWKKAIQPNTKLLYLETPSNPLTQLGDIQAIADVAHNAGAVLVVDNCFCTPALQQPIQHGADVIIHSATKYIDGQGRVLGGAICGTEKMIREHMLPFLRTAGPTLSAFNAWVLLKGLETLNIRMQQQSANALALAQWLASHPAVAKVHYPGLPGHPQHALAMRQQRTGGAVVAFEVKGQGDQLRANAWQVVDSTQLISITGNLGDTKTTITHPATTTHGRITPQARAAAGIGEGLIRVAVGLEHVQDVQRDIERGLAQARY